MRDQKFYVCRNCGNLVGMIDGKVPMICCGEVMEELKANTVDASSEKHLPVYEWDNNVLKVTVGSAIHPMEESHNIAWVYVQTKKGGQRKGLEVGKEPVVSFVFDDDEPVAIFAYCNLHGLWKTIVE